MTLGDHLLCLEKVPLKDSPCLLLVDHLPWLSNQLNELSSLPCNQTYDEGSTAVAVAPGSACGSLTSTALRKCTDPMRDIPFGLS